MATGEFFVNMNRDSGTPEQQWELEKMEPTAKETPLFASG